MGLTELFDIYHYTTGLLNGKVVDVCVNCNFRNFRFDCLFLDDFIALIHNGMQFTFDNKFFYRFEDNQLHVVI